MSRGEEVGGMDDLLREVVVWGHRTFTQSAPLTRVPHLMREWEELQKDPHSGEEMADCIMMLAHLNSELSYMEEEITWKAQLFGINLEEEVRRKLKINKARAWAPPDSAGVVEHQRTGD